MNVRERRVPQVPYSEPVAPGENPNATATARDSRVAKYRDPWHTARSAVPHLSIVYHLLARFVQCLRQRLAEHPEITGVASEFLSAVLGALTISSRLRCFEAGARLGSAVELEVIFEVKP